MLTMLYVNGIIIVEREYGKEFSKATIGNRNMEEKPRLYRYRSDGHYSIEAALKGEMYFVCPLELNDPFEFYVKYDIDKVYELIKNNPSDEAFVSKMLFENYIDFSEIEGLTSKPKPLKKCIELFEDPKIVKQTKQWLRKRIEERIVKFKESFGIVSLSENPKEGVMWSHYSNDSRGFLEIYDAELLLCNFISYLNSISDDYSKAQMKVIGARRVKYIDKFPERNELVVKLLCTDAKPDLNIGLEFIKDDETAKQVLEIITSKSSSWEYEKEIRLILPCDIYKMNRKKTETGEIIHDHFFENVSTEPIKIVLGYKASTQLEFALKYYCSQHNIEFEKSDEYFNYKID